VTFTATVTGDGAGVGTRTGTVDFRDGGVTIAGCGAQVVSLPVLPPASSAIPVWAVTPSSGV